MTNEMSCFTSLTGWPKTRISPALGDKIPAMACNSVVLPDPLGPMTAVIFPCGIVKLDADTARCEPRYNTMSWAVTRVMRLLRSEERRAGKEGIACSMHMTV